MRDLFGDNFCPPDDGRSVGCDHCPSNYIPGVKKIKGLVHIKKRKLFLWAQTPGAKENEQGLELVGPSGKLVWDTFAPHGITRNDVDVQNVMRCRPLGEDGTEHPPTKRELRCCSIYNEQALELNDHHAVVHLILGEVAGKQLLRGNYKKDNPLFWYDPWDAYVVLAPHPAYILRQGGAEANSWAYFDFKERFKASAACLKYPGRWGYVKALDNAAVQGEQEALELEKVIRAEAAAGRRVSADIEDGTVNGKRVILIVGFGWGEYEGQPSVENAWKHWKGKARSVVLDHPQAKFPQQRKAVLAMLKRVLEDPAIKKVFQHGSYDVNRLHDLLDITLQGYDFDTQYAAYLMNSGLRKYGLNRLLRYWFAEFMDYKEMVSKWITNLAEAPLETLVTYNCGDCHLTKLVELRTSPKINYALLQVYIQTAFVIDSMEQRGPILDRKAWQRLRDAVPKMMEPFENQLKLIAGDPSFDVSSSTEVAKLLFDKLKLPISEETGKAAVRKKMLQVSKKVRESGRSTRAETLQTIAIKTGAKAPILVLQWRALATILNTFLVGYEKSASEHNGEVRTIWHLTGANTGRLRSGGGDEAERKGIINFQNVHGNQLIKNILVSDLNWRKALDVK